MDYIFFLRNGGDGLDGDTLCYGMYFASIVQCKTLSLNMMYLLTHTIMYTFVNDFYDASGNPRHRRDPRLGTPFMAPMPRNK